MKILAIIVSLVILFSCKGNNTFNDSTDLKSKGDSLIAKTFDTLRNTLLNTISQKGIPGAIHFCNTEALSLTAAYSNKEIKIRRATDKYRNPANKADSMEQRLLDYFQQQRKEQKEMAAVLEQDKQGRKHYFKPIIMQGMCLNCHGKKDESIMPETWEAIRKFYPADLAINYKEGDLRGLWHIIFDVAGK